MNLFPREIQEIIYCYDPTFHLLYQKCMAHVRLCGARTIRLTKEIERLRNEPWLHLPGEWRPHQRRLQVHFRGALYTLVIPPDYPFEPPRVSQSDRFFRAFDCWSPAACLLSVLLTCHVEGLYGTEMC